MKNSTQKILNKTGNLDDSKYERDDQETKKTGNGISSRMF